MPARIGVVVQRPIEIGPPLRPHLPFQGRADIPLGTWSKLKRGPLGRALAKAPTDVGAADHQVLTIISAPSDQDVDVWIVGVPVVYHNPIELGAEIAFGIGHQLARKGAQTVQLGRILG
jgi:hypothetical protein